MTQVDPIIATRRQVPAMNRLVGWLADVDTEPAATPDQTGRSTLTGTAATAAADAASVAPPSDEVRREIRRLELEALQAELDRRAASARAAALDAGPSAEPSGPATDSPPDGESPNG